MSTLLKLGGSVVTDKSTERTLDEASLESIASDLAQGGDDRLVLIHGGGSFGHPAAERHGVSTTVATREARAIAEVHHAMLELNAAVVDRLAVAGLDPVGVHPLSMARRAGDRLEVDVDTLTALLDEGFTPVLHGDGVVDVGRGVSVLSGDDLLVALADALSFDRIGLCANVPGVLDEDGDVIERIEHYQAVAGVTGDASETDVTGGMDHKVRTLLERGISA
ncbi:MAG: isopentenyl phosphate kinase, partial [Halobacteriota archaeon]